MPVPTIKTTTRFNNGFAKHPTPQVAIDAFCAAFLVWKAGLTQTPPKGATGFGRDNPYATPKVLNQLLLMHVHLMPTEPTKRNEWVRKARRDSMSDRTSDKVLVYVFDKVKDEYLLLDILPEGESHAIAERSRSVYNRSRVLSQLAEIAENFLTFGVVP